MTSPFSFAAFQAQRQDPPVGPRRASLSFAAFEEQRRQEEERQREAGRSRDGVLPTVTTTAPAPTVAEKAGQFARGVGLGATQSLTSLGEVAGMVPGLGGIGETARALEQKAATALAPQGPYGLGGQVLGRLGGEVVQAMGAAKPIAKGVATVAPRVGQALRTGLEGTRVQRALATTAANAPIDVVQGLKQEEGLLLPGRAGSVAENVLFSGAAGALFGGKPSQRTSIAPDVSETIPPGPTRDRVRLLGAGTEPPMQGPAIPMPGVRTAGGPLTDPSRLLPGAVPDDAVRRAVQARFSFLPGSEALPLGPTRAPETRVDRLLMGPRQDVAPLPPTQTAPIAARGELSAADVMRRLEAAATTAPAATPGGIDIVNVGGRSPQRQRRLMRALDNTQAELERQATRRRLFATPSDDALRELEVAAVRGQQQAPTSSILDAQGRAARSGAASPELVTQLGTTVGGAALGAATTPEGEPESAIGRALAGALAGYGVSRAGLAGVRRFGATSATMPRGSTPAMQTVNATINTGDRAVADVPAWLTKRERAYTNLVSETSPLELAAAQGGQKSAMQGAISQAQGSGQAALQYLRDRVQLPIAAAKGQLDDVRALVKARRDLDIRVKGGAAKSAVPTEVLEQAVRDGEANEAVRNAADALRDVERDLLRMRYEAGMLTDEAYQAIVASEDFYTPFVREFAEDAYRQMGAKGGKWYQRTSGVQRMDRTMDAISQTADPLEVVTASVTRTFRDVGRQRVQNILGDLVEDGSLADVIRVVPENALANDAARVFKQVRGGKQVTYEVLDPELFDAIAAQGTESANVLLRVAQAMKNVKTAGITVMPDFAMANVIRDVAASGIQRPDVRRAAVETGLGALGGGAIGAARGDDDKIVQNFLIGAGMGAGVGAYARPFAQSLSAMGNIISANISDAMAKGTLPANQSVQTLLDRAAQSYREFLRAGASTEGFYVRTPKDAREVLQRLGAEERASIITPKRWWETLQAIGSVAEQSTRLAAFKQVRERGASLPQAAREAQDRTLRFANVGKATKGLASVTPFWNAKVQGWDKLGRMLKQPKTWGLGTAMLTAPSVALWNMNKDNPEYWERPIWERNLFWLVPKDEGGFYRIPKPFEIGYLFASMPERSLDFLAQQGVLSSAAPETAEPGRAAGRAAWDMATSTFEGTLPVPQIASLPGQLATDYDLFRNRRIVTRPGLPTELQGTPETSSIARQAAKFGLSPEQVDFALRDVAGTTGREALRAVDVVAGSFGAPAPRMDRLVEAPVVGQMQRRFTTQDRGQTESELTARDRLRRVESVAAGMRELQRGGNQAEMRTYFERHTDDLLLHEQLRDLSRALDQITADRRTVERDRTLPKTERDRLLRAIRDAGTRVSQQINQTEARP
jgi:hypothetical protein